MFPNWDKLLSHTHGFLSTYPEGHLALVCCMVESNNEHLGSETIHAQVNILRASVEWVLPTGRSLTGCCGKGLGLWGAGRPPLSIHLLTIMPI